MKFSSWLLILSLTSCFFFSDKSQAEKDIENYFSENNLNPGAGKTEVTSIEIISIQDKTIKALVIGHYSNNSLPAPESRELIDTMCFQYFDENNPTKLKIISSEKADF
jgi:hypothetical protein